MRHMPSDRLRVLGGVDVEQVVEAAGHLADDQELPLAVARDLAPLGAADVRGADRPEVLRQVHDGGVRAVGRAGARTAGSQDRGCHLAAAWLFDDVHPAIRATTTTTRPATQAAAAHPWDARLPRPVTLVRRVKGVRSGGAAEGGEVHGVGAVAVRPQLDVGAVAEVGHSPGAARASIRSAPPVRSTAVDDDAGLGQVRASR